MEHPSKTILLVDDDPDEQIFFKIAVNEAKGPFVLRTAKDGQEALDLLSDPATKLPDFVFLDVNMPRVNGIECLSQIRSCERLKDLCVIVCTSSNSPVDYERARNARASGFFTKPISLDVLFRIVSMILHGTHPPGKYLNSAIEFFDWSGCNAAGGGSAAMDRAA
jgi:CheY-like chemotaxis protein